jgi:hypothetical protein
MPLYQFTATSKRDNGTVRGTIELIVEAENYEDAEDKVRSSLPGADWEQWVSLYGIGNYDQPVEKVGHK